MFILDNEPRTKEIKKVIKVEKPSKTATEKFI